MALDDNATKLASLLDPEVFADFVEAKLTDNMVFAPVATVDTTLVGRAGDTLKFPVYAYIGDAETVEEGADVPINELTQSEAHCTVHKIGNGVQITDEAILSGLGDPVGEASRQLVLSIDNALDNEVLGCLDDITGAMEFETAAEGVMDADDIADALTLFGEDIDGTKYLFMNPADYKLLRKNALASGDWIPASQMAGEILVKGVVGEVQGCQVIISNKLTTPDTAYIVKPDAVRIVLKRDTMVETDRDIINKTNYITVDKHEVVYLYDASKAIKVVKKD